MILYFSGTGNSEYVARKLGKSLGDEVMNLLGKIKRKDYSELKSKTPWVIVCPAYAWRIPRILQEWLEKTRLSGSKKIYFVMTCGGDIGNAGAYLEKLCVLKKQNFCGCAAVIMPENYIALFNTPSEVEAVEIINRAEKKIADAALNIKVNLNFDRPRVGLSEKLSSGIVNKAFYPLFVHAKKFYATNACVSCGLCEKLCPLNNIRLKNGKPVWNDDCTHCMACICRCPEQAIEYGKRTKSMTRYNCPIKID